MNQSLQSKLWPVVFILFLHTFCLSAKADISCSAHVGAADPNPAFTGELIVASLDMSTGDPALHEEETIVGTSYNWYVSTVHFSPDGSSWNYGLSGFDVTIADASAKQTTLRCKFDQPMYYAVDVGCSYTVTIQRGDGSQYNLSASGSGTMTCVAGNWVVEPPDIHAPTTPLDGSSDIYGYTGSYDTNAVAYAHKLVHRDYNWVKAGVNGGRQGTSFQDSLSPIEINTGDETEWTTKWHWLPIGSTSKRQLFTGTVMCSVNAQVAGDVDNAAVFAPYGTGSTTAHAYVSITPHGSGTSSGGTAEATLDISKTEGSNATGSASIGFPPSASVGINDAASDSWDPSIAWGPTPITFNIDSQGLSEVSLTAKMSANASISWGAGAEGPFVALSEAKIASLVIAKN